MTPDILWRIHAHWEGSQDWDHIMLWATMCLCFFGFLQASEAVAPDTDFDPSQHLSYQDVAVDDAQNPSHLQVYIKQSKTDSFTVGVKVLIVCTGGDLCPVAALLAYMVLRGPKNGPLFCFQSGAPLTRSKFVAILRIVFSEVGINCSKYSGHSFRIGAATTEGYTGLSHQDNGQVEECGLSAVCQDATSPASVCSKDYGSPKLTTVGY